MFWYTRLLYTEVDIKGGHVIQPPVLVGFCSDAPNIALCQCMPLAHSPTADALFGTRARRYNSLKTTFEARLASLADTIRCAVESAQQDQVLLQLNASINTREFAPAHAHALIKRHLASERDAFFHELAVRLADAEAEVSQCTRRNEELGSSLSVLQSEASREERSRVEVTTVNADIQDLRREYQVRRPFGARIIFLYRFCETLRTFYDSWYTAVRRYRPTLLHGTPRAGCNKYSRNWFVFHP